MTNSCLEYGNRFVVAFAISELWEDEKSYFKGLEINIGPYQCSS
jgi:hypothetical protein